MILPSNKSGRCNVDRKGVYNIGHILKLIGTGIKYFDCERISMNKKFMMLFKLKGTKCLKCGLEGEFFANELNVIQTQKTGKYVLHLYAIKDGEEVLMTKDHIIPKSQGGSDSINNLRPLCFHCNNSRGASLYDISDVDQEELIKSRKKIEEWEEIRRGYA